MGSALRGEDLDSEEDVDTNCEKLCACVGCTNIEQPVEEGIDGVSSGENLDSEEDIDTNCE